MNTEAEKEVLVVVSKLKNYIRSASGMNTSNNVGAVLSDVIRKLCDDAIAKAKEDGRKTVMDRDFPCTCACSAAPEATPTAPEAAQS